MADRPAAPAFVVPTIDLEPWWHGDADDRASIALAVDRAASTVGFMQVRGHHIDAEVIDAMRTSTDRFLRWRSTASWRRGPPT